MPAASMASSNWLALQKKLSKTQTIEKPHGVIEKRPPHKRRKIAHNESKPISTSTSQISVEKEDAQIEGSEEHLAKDINSLTSLRDMVKGKLTLTEAQKAPGKYLALDCEMVGIGIEGSESSLARVSLVNYYGHAILDDMVRQREQVVDYRTQFSGIREKDMKRAKPFDEVQKRVAELLKDKILIGHAVHNDLKVLLLSHPWPQTRDTQVYAAKHKLVKTKRAALRNLVKQELNLAIQEGEHSSARVTDARATMAIYRLHKKDWEKGSSKPSATTNKKRKKPDDADDNSSEGRNGISSGLSVVITRKGERQNEHKSTGGRGKEKKQWWKEIGNSSKGRVTLS